MLKKEGFSLIELVVVIAILLILAGFFLISLNLLRHKNSLDYSAQEIIKMLRLAQNKTLASEGASSFGVYFESNKLTLFKGTSFNPFDTENQERKLADDVVISQISLANATSSVVFDRLTGTTANSGSVKIELVNDSSQNKDVFIETSGAISLSGSSANDSSRLTDSRHTHVLFNQNTKTAVTLTLFFPDDGFTENIDYQTYLNVAQTEFFWEEDVAVSGVTQKLKIHSHELTDLTTLFCIHRDRRQNTKAVNIFLDGQNLINYTAAGTTTPGSSAWAQSPQIQ
ncbi:type II secretion system GspH family protein [Patescibacteria group bacterium]|nr:type II secretion system GspH family protein [Patescibacteria group bacterium]